MNKHLEALKAIKAPWWSRLLGNYRAWKRARAARLHKDHIATIKVWYQRDLSELANGFIQLYQRGDGKRSCEWLPPPIRGQTLEQAQVYQLYVIKWMHNRLDNAFMRRLEASQQDAPKGGQWVS